VLDAVGDVPLFDAARAQAIRHPRSAVRWQRMLPQAKDDAAHRVGARYEDAHDDDSVEPADDAAGQP